MLRRQKEPKQQLYNNIYKKPINKKSEYPDKIFTFFLVYSKIILYLCCAFGNSPNVLLKI